MRINFKSKSFKSIEANPDKSLMNCLLDSQIPVASSCGGDGICGKCRITVIENSQNLTSPSDHELELLKKLKTSSDVRLSCQCFVRGEVTIDATYW